MPTVSRPGAWAALCSRCRRVARLAARAGPAATARKLASLSSLDIFARVFTQVFPCVCAPPPRNGMIIPRYQLAGCRLHSAVTVQTHKDQMSPTRASATGPCATRLSVTTAAPQRPQQAAACPAPREGWRRLAAAAAVAACVFLAGRVGPVLGQARSHPPSYSLFTITNQADGANGVFAADVDRCCAPSAHTRTHARAPIRGIVSHSD
jgi:hypothetical protein